MTKVIAHRGASAYELENSLAAFRAAIRLGADGVELDVHTTADAIPIVHHDDVVGLHRIPTMRYRDLQDRMLANGEPIPTLDAALSTLGTHLDVFVEVKSLPEAHDAALLEVLDCGPAPEHYHVHSFDHRIIRRLRYQRAALRCGVLSASYLIQPLAQLADTGATALWQQQDLVDHELVQSCHMRGFEVYPWTVDQPDRMRELLDMGVDAICTNRPDVAREVVG